MSTRHSAIYEGTVRHRRFAERGNEFTTRIALAYVDLDELDTLPIARPNKLVRFERADYLGDPAKPLHTEVRDLVEQRTGHRPRGPIRLLTQLRSFGHCFNPVSFYYCFDAPGQKVQAVVADVTNTPWGERHAYVIEQAGESRIAKGDSEKLLHVSPFMAMDHRYNWRVSDPGETLSVHIASERQQATAFDATLSLRRRPLTRKALARCAGTTIRTVALIYAHALKLKLKGVRVHPHPSEATP
jgi:DUF1365 family protein